MMSKFYERRHKPQKDEKYTNYAMAYFQKELEESNQYLVTPQERENIVALTYRANPGDQKTRLVQLKAQKCSCLAFQDHKIACRHAIAVCRFFNVKLENYIAKFYEISEYREQYRYSLLPVLLDDLEPDGVTKPPLDAALRGRPIKRMKRRTRETEARRLGNLVSSSSRKEQQDEARNRYQSGVTYFQQQTHQDTLNDPDQRVSSQPSYSIFNHHRNVSDPLSIAQPPPLWQRIRAIQARLEEAETIGEPYRTQAVNRNRNNEHDQSHTVQASTTHAEHPTSRSRPPEQPVSQLNGERPSLDTDEQQRNNTSQVDTAASQVTHIDSTVTNNNFIFGTSSSVPNITINVTASPPGGNKRPVANGDEEGNNVQNEEPPSLSTRSRKRARTDRS
ncbi:hypothetical protein K469DRAFT_725100 [Zopfia rhizophila CBS 207.26]|uniref:SWIM-type domain-containing protein n=1 Tax=Zopfia rhizophila CBS 207.26 TaxID=1314779 RepID=A0A6A6EAJ5_9PEZI|nr:hypothetical protein K469DRAFT_725100 [Zopfia rhizophila CBS 207.26]